MDEALQSGANIVLLASTCSATKEGLVESALSSLGAAVAEQVRVFQCPQSSPADEQLMDEGDTLEKSLHKAAAKVRSWHSYSSIASPQ